nr:MAG TPA: hypothetical protein [Caudoviricetes sp.]
MIRAWGKGGQVLKWYNYIIGILLLVLMGLGEG